MKKIFLFSLLMAGLTWQSCEKAEKIENFPFSESKIVLDCILTPDSTITAILYKSLSILDNAPNKVLKNAKVTLYRDDNPLMTLDAANLDNLYYFSPHKPVPGHTYRLEASLSGYETVNALTSLPEPVSPGKIEVIVEDTNSWYYSYGTPYNYYFMNGYARVSLTDKAETENYYALVLSQIDTMIVYGETGDTLSREPVKSYYYEYSSSRRSPLVEFTDGTVYYFSDQYFNGQTINIEIPFSHGGEKRSWIMDVELRTLSRDEYLYRRTLQMFDQNGDDPFSEPVKMYTNVENGYGIFAGSSTSETIVPVSM